MFFSAIRLIYYRQDEHRQRRSPYFLNWQTADILYKRLYVHDDHIVQEDRRNKRSETPLEFRPVKGPISIEQLPAMLAARHVKRYPFSQRDDPAIM
jgi:hypothetical protein